MNLQKAIEISTEDIKEDKYFLPIDFINAIQLGAEALIRLQSQRQQKVPASIPLLPSETKD